MVILYPEPISSPGFIIVVVVVFTCTVNFPVNFSKISLSLGV